MTLSVGIITYNRPNDLIRTLGSLFKQPKPPDELVICDDSSEDTTEKELENLKNSQLKGIPWRDPSGHHHQISRLMKIVYKRNPARMGPPKARNILLSMVTKTICAFIDDDVILGPDWIERIIEPYDDPAVGSVGGPCLTSNEHCVLELPTLDGDNRNHFRPSGRHIDYSDCWVPSQPQSVDFFRGANMSFRLNAIKEVGGFDENYGRGFSYLEETDVMRRLGKAGYKLIYHPKAMLYHLCAKKGGSRPPSRNKWYWTGRNEVYFLKKNFPSRLPSALPGLLFGNNDVANLSLIVSSWRKGDRNAPWLLVGYLDELINASVKHNRST